MFKRTVIITPSRSRPESLDRMITSATENSGGPTLFMAAIDDDDPELGKYYRLHKKHDDLVLQHGPRKTLSEWTNELAQVALSSFNSKHTFLVSMGDDHVVRTSNWDSALMASMSLEGPGFVYGDDMINGSGLCTSWMVSAKVVEALGWMMLPDCRHMYVDNVIMELGRDSDRLTYNPSVVIEHMHPILRKSDIDQTYLDGNASMDKDLEAFRNWHAGPKFKQDVQTIKELTW